MAMSLAIIAVAIEFCVSANFLTWIGVAYMTEGGSLLEKVHPGTYVLCVSFATRVATQDRPNATIWKFFGGDYRIALYFSSLAGCLIYMLLSTGSGNVIVLLDTFLPAGLLACVVHDASPRERWFLTCVFRCGIMTNCVVALGEGVAHATLVPLYLNDIGYHPAVGEFRPTGFYDHPLTGATMTLMGLALAPQGLLRKSTYLALAIAALIAFGGRVAAVAALASAILIGGARLGQRVLCRDRSALLLMLYYGLWFAAGCALAILAYEAGFGERFLGHLYWDPSAQIRIAQWRILEKFSKWQLLFGVRREDLLSLLTQFWLQSGVEVIENFWLLMLVGLGIVGFPLFVTGFLSLLAWCWHTTCFRGRFLLVSVLMVVSTSNSLGRKSTLLVGLVAAIACMPRGRLVVVEKVTERHKQSFFVDILRAMR